MTLQLIKISILSLVFFSCGDSMTNKVNIKEALGDLSDKDLIPHYETVFSSDSVELENVDPFLNGDTIDDKACLTILSNSCKELKADYNNYLIDSYRTLDYTEDRLPYIDISNISRFIVWKFKFNDNSCFDKIFENAELILNKGSESTQNLIIVGLFEAIQNVGGWHKVDYYKGFDKWLRPHSKKAWDDLIDFLEKKSDEAK